MVPPDTKTLKHNSKSTDEQLWICKDFINSSCIYRINLIIVAIFIIEEFLHLWTHLFYNLH